MGFRERTPWRVSANAFSDALPPTRSFFTVHRTDYSSFVEATVAYPVFEVLSQDVVARSVIVRIFVLEILIQDEGNAGAFTCGESSLSVRTSLLSVKIIDYRFLVKLQWNLELIKLQQQRHEPGKLSRFCNVIPSFPILRLRKTEK